VWVVALLATGRADAQDVRQHTRIAPRGTTVTEAQAAALTLTLATVSLRPIQTSIRTAGTIDPSGKVLSATISGAAASLVKVGQRARAFPPSSKSSTYQASVTRVTPQRAGATIEVSLAATGRQNALRYVLEVVVEQGPFLSVPNEAIIEEGDRHVVYVESQPGQYTPQEIQVGIQGELYTQVLAGVEDGAQVVTLGSFFIDAEHKLKGSDDHRLH
jgi:hypothetical protein